jgi:hypothetical protein
MKKMMNIRFNLAAIASIALKWQCTEKQKG